MKKLFYLLCGALALLFAACSSAEQADGHEYIDLGLPSGTLWATCNVGANSPEENGDYFAWGETQPKHVYNWETYKLCEGDFRSMTKYCTELYYGTIDNKTTLELSDDAANVNWGGSWRMPTYEEFDELRTECTWKWTTKKGVAGRKVTGPSGNSIFLPATGSYKESSLREFGKYGNYWCSSLDTDDSNRAYYMSFGKKYVFWYQTYRQYAYTIRPVMRK